MIRVGGYFMVFLGLALLVALPGWCAPAEPVPELDPSMVTGATALIGGLLLLARDGRPRQARR